MNFSDLHLSDLKKVYPSKNGLNLVIGFDTTGKSVRFWRTFKLDFANADVQEFPYTAHFLSDEFLEEFRGICSGYVANLPSSKQMACYLVMPDSMVSMDNVSLPQMPAKKREGALNSHLENLYKNYKELQFNRYIFASNKQYITYFLTVLKKARLTALYRAMAENKLYAKETTFTGNCLVNSVLHLSPKYRKKNFIFLDIHAEKTNVAVCIKGKTAGFASFMLGTVHLTSERVLQENMQYEHDVADLAIINAKEKARMKQLTVSGAELDAVADDVMMQLAEGVNRNEESPEEGQGAQEQQEQPRESALQSTAEELAETAEERAIAEQFDAEDAAEAEELRQAELMQQIAEARRKKVFARKMPKRLPKFMLRPEPENEEGIIYENFRMFSKWAMLYYKWLKEQEFMPDLDCVLVNMPEKFRFVIDRANADDERSALPFEFFDAAGGDAVTGNLDMIGALYAGVFNKRENF